MWLLKLAQLMKLKELESILSSIRAAQDPMSQMLPLHVAQILMGLQCIKKLLSRESPFKHNNNKSPWAPPKKIRNMKHTFSLKINNSLKKKKRSIDKQIFLIIFKMGGCNEVIGV